MSVVDAVRRWQRRQANILKRAYTAAWQRGVDAYRASRPSTEGANPARLPAAPDPGAMSRALHPALYSLSRVGTLLSVIAPTAEQIAQAGSYPAALRLAARDYLRKQAWTLANSISIIWAGEQAGYAQAADAAGDWLEWELDPTPGVEHCEDCPVLATFPPMPYEQWPTHPGDGQTACNVGCRCSLVAVNAPVVADRTLTGSQQTALAQIALRKPVLGDA